MIFGRFGIVLAALCSCAGHPAAQSPSDAEQSIANLRPGFRACYNGALERGENPVGSARFTVRIEPSGQVASVRVEDGAQMTPEALRCLEDLLKGAMFQAHEQEATLSVPVSFKHP
jgi:hypothetical protein